MLPLLKAGDGVLVNPYAYRRHPPQPGDIVVVRHPFRTDVTLIKRIRAITQDNYCLLQGDNASASTDSASFGKVSLRLIKGRVTGRF